MTLAYPRVVPCGDSAIAVEFGDRVDAIVNQRVIALDRAVREAALPGVVECVPTYRSLLVHLDPLIAEHATLSSSLARLASAAHAGTVTGRRWRVPVVYGGDHGADLVELAARHGLTPDQVVEIHAGSVYRVYMIGFVPGFTYLGGLDSRLATPRRNTPRTSIPGGSVSIGGAQSAIGSIPSPSGWHLIGRTPVLCFHPGRDPVFLFEAGDEIAFEPMRAERWERLAARSEAGEIIAECTPG